jgi:hypothetical protein
MAKYVQIDPTKFESMLQACGFGRRTVRDEIVYVKLHEHYSSIVVKVWTGLSVSQGASRGAGEDAIRVTVAYESELPIDVRDNRSKLFKHNGSRDFGIYKATRTFRVGKEQDVLDRVYERMREAYLFANQWLRENWEALPKSDAKKSMPR